MLKLEQKPGNGIWYVVWYDTDTGNTKRRSLKTKNEKEAQAKLKKIEKAVSESETVKAAAEITGVALPTKFKAVSLYTLLDNFAQETAHKRKPEGQVTIERRIRYIKTVLDDVRADKVTAAMIRGYIKKRQKAGIRLAEIKPQTINRELEVLDAAFNWQLKQPDSGMNYKPYLEMPYLTPEEYEAIIPTKDHIDQIRQYWTERENWPQLNTLEMILCTCMRPGGIRSIQGWRKEGLHGWVDPDDWTVRFLQTKKKRGTDTWRTLSLTADSLKHFQKQYKRNPQHLTFQHTNYGLYHACDVLGLPKYKWTSFRHFFVYEAKCAGLSEWDVLSITGHYDSNLIKRVYGRLDDRAAIEALRKKETRPPA